MPAQEPPEKTIENPSEPVANAHSGRGLLRSTSVVSAMTLLSRVLGLVRDVVFARVFGASLVMDAFIVANRIPNMLRRFFAEGAFSQGFVPVMARYKERESNAEAKAFIDAVAGTLGVVLFLVTLAGVIAAPILVVAVAPGFVREDGGFELASLMLRFTFPYLLFISLTAFAGGILNTHGRFAVPAFTPVILNVVLIAAALWLAPQLDEPGLALAYAVFLAGVMQLLFQLPFLGKISALPRPRWNPAHPGVRRVGQLMLPAIFGSSVAQVNVLLGGIIASLLGVGKISLLYYSDRLMEFPLGLFGIALATVTLPTLSRHYTAASHQAFSSTVDWSMKLVLLIALPAATGLIVLAKPIVGTIFYGGEFSVNDVEMTALSLQAFSLGLVGFSFVKILAPAYFAREDTRTPVRIALLALAVNFLLSVVLAYTLTRIGYPATHAGLALAISIAALLNAWLLYRGLRRDAIIDPSPGWLGLVFKCFAGIAVMAACLYMMNLSLDDWLNLSSVRRIGTLIAQIAAGAVVYALTLLLLGVRPSTLRLGAG